MKTANLVLRIEHAKKQKLKELAEGSKVNLSKYILYLIDLGIQRDIQIKMNQAAS